MQNVVKLCLKCKDSMGHYNQDACVFSIEVISKAVFGTQANNKFIFET
jgi:hypothetical protein